MFYKIGRAFRNLKDWLPIILKDEQWDYGFLYQMLHKKLELKEAYYRSDLPSSADALEVAEEIRVVKEALERLIDDDYVPLGVGLHNVREVFAKEDALRKKDMDTVFDGMKENIRKWWD
ncbi:hypothetical protein [Priestia megaterium]|uniref:hypothetical protein n=1 Tax=Priestia megaterium TaxID=1404 RepID=UPI000BFDA220|nr:hypothetical protein [Priestia megaterium]PGO60590.1 hypothetical protein CN981_08560 [Priestia megaterium]